MVTICMPLLNEGTDVWSPVTATRLAAGTYRIEGEVPNDEDWAFSPGSVVLGAPKTFSDGTIGIVAVSLV